MQDFVFIIRNKYRKNLVIKKIIIKKVSNNKVYWQSLLSIYENTKIFPALSENIISSY